MTTKKTTTTKKTAPAPVLVDIQGKPYEIVASKQKRFRFDHPIESKWAIIINIIHMDESVVVMECQIKDPEGVIVSQDYAEEQRSGMINSKSAIENGSTSAQGRALTAAGYNASNEVASAEEVENAIAQRGAPAPKAAAPKPVAKPVPKPVSSKTALANDRQKTEIRASFKGLEKEASIALRKDLLVYGKITLPYGIDPESFTLAQIDSLLTEAGAAQFINRPPF